MNDANNNSNKITKQDLDDLKIDKSKPIKIVCTFKQVDALGPEQMRRKAMRAFKAAHMLKKNHADIARNLERAKRLDEVKA